MSTESTNIGGVTLSVQGGDVIADNINLTAAIGRQLLKIIALQGQVAQLKTDYGALLAGLRRAQDGEFDTVVVDIDGLKWTATEKPKAEADEPAPNQGT